MWFRDDWLNAEGTKPGHEIFAKHPKIVTAAKEFCGGAKYFVPHSVYVNLMAAMLQSGPCHTDNPKFRGRERVNTPQRLLRNMFSSGLFNSWYIDQMTCIWWMSDIEGGAFTYWPNGPDQEPLRRHGDMANSAICGDNHFMYHQVGPIGPFDKGTIRVTPVAELAPADDLSGDWVVIDHGEEVFRTKLQDIRVSILTKGDVYDSKEVFNELWKDTLSMEQVVDIFNSDLEERGEIYRLSLDKIDSVEARKELSKIYPEPAPVGADPISALDYIA
tara:strand:- start:294 stop:1115 length:822 start_codon:yes stop_codon:yes gene_type:complete